MSGHFQKLLEELSTATDQLQGLIDKEVDARRDVLEQLKGTHLRVYADGRWYMEEDDSADAAIESGGNLDDLEEYLEKLGKFRERENEASSAKFGVRREAVNSIIRALGDLQSLTPERRKLLQHEIRTLFDEISDES